MTTSTETTTWKTLLGEEKQKPYFAAILNFLISDSWYLLG
jgi:hypothetical protein